MKKISTLTKCILFNLILFSFVSLANAQYNVIVAKDGSGNFTTLQAAIDAAPSSQTVAYKILVKNGKYREKVTIPTTKTFIYVIGESINGAIISWDDYAGKAGVTEIATVTINANDCAFMNITVENSWGRANDGPQALAIKANADRLIFKNCRFISGQDTVMANGNGKKQYFSNCYIDGNTDYIYGSAIAIFDSCIIFSRDRTDGSTGGYLTAANTPIGQTYGYVFRNCLLPDNNGNTNYTLGRPWGNDVQPNTSETKVVFLNCRMGKTIVPARWSPWSATTNTAVITYAEYNTKYFNGTNVDLSNKVSWSQEFNSTQATPYLVTSNIFGTWDPCAVLASACVPFSPILSLSNVRVNRNSTGSTVKFNLCWPANGATLQLFRSTDSANFATTATAVGSLTTTTDTTVSYQFIDALPPTGTSYFYKVKAIKVGMDTCTSDTLLKVNTSVPLNNDFRSLRSGGWSNNVSAVSTIASGAITGVTISSSPTGYTGVPTVTFAAAPSGGTTAIGTAIVTGGVVTGVNITNPGAGYTTAPSVTFSVTGVGGLSVWEKYTSSSSSWAPVALGTGPSNTNVTIVSGHTVTMNALTGIGSLTIENGATVNATGNATGATQTMRIGSGTAPVSATIKNDGVFGSTNGVGDGIILEAFTSCANLTITGTGTTSIARFRPTAGNISAVPSVLNVIIDQDINFAYNNVCFTGYYNASGNTAAEKCTITINAGRTVKLTHASGGIHAGSLITNPQGNITYNINGILDLSATTTVQTFAPSSTTATGVATMNITGLVKLGTGGLTTVSTAATNLGSAKINIKTGGVLDASASNTLTTSTTANGSFIGIEGTGVLKRTVAATPVVFAIGTSATSYNPVVLTNTGTTDIIAVGVSNTLDNTVTDPTKVVNKQWTITPQAIGSSCTATFGWVNTDEASAFDRNNNLSVIKYNGTNWDNNTATLTGAGTVADPYVSTTATSFTTYGLFAVANTTALPLTLLSFNVVKDANIVSVVWSTENEINMSSFIVERSNNNNSFEKIGAVAPNNNTNNTYTFLDEKSLTGNAYYRLKMIDKDGSYEYSKVVRVADKQSVLSLYPNPAKALVTVAHTKAEKNATIEVITVDGRKLIIQKVMSGALQTIVDVASLHAGNYIMVLNNNGQRTMSLLNKQ